MAALDGGDRDGAAAATVMSRAGGEDMSAYEYTITVDQTCADEAREGTPIGSSSGGGAAQSGNEPPESGGTTLCFEVAGNEDWFRLLGRVQQLGLAEGGAPALLVGLKLLGGVVLANRGNPLFKELHPQLGAFMRRLKQRAQRKPADCASAEPASR